MKKVEDKVTDLEKKIPPLEEKVNKHDNDISALNDRTKQNEDAIRQLQEDSIKYVRYYMFWIVAILLGTVGAIYMMNNYVFKVVTIWSYIVGVIGTALIATLFYLYYRSKKAPPA